MIDFKVRTLFPKCEEFGLVLSDEAIDRLETYGNMLLEWNGKMNLTAITEPDEVLYKHFYDCLLFFSAVNVPKNASVIDVGTGAGFPCVVLKIARPDINITLLDSLNKRTVFLNEVCKSLCLDADIYHLRAEEGGQDSKLRERFDIACARAVGKLNVLAEYLVPFVKTGGLFVAMKGAEIDDELNQSLNAFKLLGCEAPKVINRDLRENEKRSFVIAKKISHTPPKYPRNSSKIAKSAL